MSKNSEKVKRWRENVKRRMIAAFQGKCTCCGYDACADALEYHHLDPNEKEFGIGRIMANPKSWNKIVAELRKCIMACSNCHREIHAGIRQVPEDAIRFDERYDDSAFDAEGEAWTSCPVCKSPKPITRKYCSHECEIKGRPSKTVIDWSKWDVFERIQEKGMTFDKLAEEIGCSPSAVWKMTKKILLQQHISDHKTYTVEVIGFAIHNSQPLGFIKELTPRQYWIDHIFARNQENWRNCQREWPTLQEAAAEVYRLAVHDPFANVEVEAIPHMKIISAINLQTHEGLSIGDKVRIRNDSLFKFEGQISFIDGRPRDHWESGEKEPYYVDFLIDGQKIQSSYTRENLIKIT